MKRTGPKFAVWKNKDHAASLDPRKVYRMVADEPAASGAMGVSPVLPGGDARLGMEMRFLCALSVLCG
jgi:hypothetical protein